MPQLQVRTTEAEKVWSSPDGQRTIYKLTLDYEGKPVAAKTYSNAIAEVGWEGTVETYEKPGKNGVETFVRQLPKEGGFSPSGQASSSGKYQPKDEKAIQAMWAIGQAVQCMSDEQKAKVKLEDIEANAQELFAMVTRVKASDGTGVEVAQVDAPLEGQMTIEDIKEVFEEKDESDKA